MNPYIDEHALRNYFKDQKMVLAVYLFGSFSKGQARPASDVDLALLLNPSLPEGNYLDERLRYMSELSAVLGRETDVVILNEAPPVLVHQILLHGKLIDEKNHGAMVAFKARSMIDYVDWLPYKIRLDEAVLKHFKAARHG